MSREFVLSDALDTLANSHYPVYLGPLYNLLRSTNTSDLEFWASRNAECLTSIASSVVEQVELGCPYALEVISPLCQVRSLRDAVLEESPHILSHLLIRSLDNNEVAGLATEACVSLLGFTLPQAVPLPASAGTLLIRLFDRLSDHPNNTNAWPLFRVLDGAGAELISLVPRHRLIRFNDHVRNLLKKVKGGDKDALMLTLIAITAVTYHSCSQSGQDVVVPATPSPDAPALSAHVDKLSELFTGSGARNTALYAVAQTIHACGQEFTSQTDEALKHLHLAAKILTIVDTEAIKSQMESKPSVENKLYQKIAAFDLAPAIKLEASAIACQVAQTTGSKPPTLIKACEQSVENYLDKGRDSVAQVASLRTLLQYLDSALGSSCFSSIARQLLIATTNDQNQDAASVSRAATITAILDDLSTRSLYVRRCIVRQLTETETSNYLQEFLNKPCSIIDNKYNKNLTTVDNALASMLLSVAVSSQHDDILFPLEVSIGLLHKQRKLALSQPRDQRTKPDKEIGPITQAPYEASIRAHGQDWQALVSDKLDKNAQHCREAVVALFGKACQDLETRCHNAEQPWRDEQASHEKTRHELTAARGHMQELEQGLDIRRAQIEALGTEVNELKDSLACSHTEMDEQLSRRQQLETQLREEQSHAQRQAKTAEKEYEELKLRYDLTMSEKTERIDDLRVDIDTSNARIKQVEAHAHASEQALWKEREQLTSLREVEAHLNWEISDLRAVVERTQASLVEANSSLEEQRAKTAEDLDNLQRDNTTRIQALEQEIVQAKEQLQKEVDEREMAMEGQRSEFEAELAAITHARRELENRAKFLQEGSRLKDIENTKLQNKWRDMQRSVQKMFSASDEMLPPTVEAPDEDYTVNLDLGQHGDMHPLHADGSSSGSLSSRNEPTAKRLRSRQPMAPPQARDQTLVLQSPTSPTKAQRTTGREPLKDTQINRLSRRSLPTGRKKTADVSPLKSVRIQGRKSIAATTLEARGGHGKENAYTSIDELGFRTMCTQDLDATTEEF